MTPTQLFWSLLGSSSIVGLAVAAWLKYLADRSIEKIKQVHLAELDMMRNAFQVNLREFEAALNQKQAVSKTQFDAEFTCMREAYSLASQVLLLIRGIRPTQEIVPAGEDDTGYAKRLSERLRGLAEAHDKLIGYQEGNRPFVSEPVYKGLNGISKAARLELGQLRLNLDELRSMDWYLQGSRNVSACESSHEELIASIRSRLAELRVV